MSVAAYYGVGSEDFDKLKRDLDTKNGFGTSVYRMEAYTRDRLKLEATLFKDQTGPATRRLLKKALDEGKPVICSIQAWADNPRVYADPTSNEDGHYVVAIGYDEEDNFYFMDPSLTGRRGVLPWKELDRRWHENEAPGRKKDIHHHLGIVIGPNGRRVAYFSRARRID